MKPYQDLEELLSRSAAAKLLYLSPLHHKCFRPLLIHIYRLQMPDILTGISICFVSV